MQKSIRYVKVTLFCILLLSYTNAQTKALNLSYENSVIMQNQLSKLVEQAKTNNPRIKAAMQKTNASLASVKGIKSLDAPLVGFESFLTPVASFPNPFKDQLEYDYSIQQMIPFPGKLGAMANTEQKRARMLLADRLVLEQDIERNVKNLFFEIYLKDRQVEINHETVALVKSLTDITKKQYEVGLGKQSDILRAQTEQASFVNDGIVLSQQRRSMEGMLNALCARPVTTAIEITPEVMPFMVEYSLEVLLDYAEKKRPELQSMDAAVSMQQAELFAANKEYLPDFMLRGMYKQMAMSSDYWSIMVGATVPIAPWSKDKVTSQKARIDAALQGTQNERENMRNMIASEVNDAYCKVKSSEERIELSTKTSIPLAEQALISAMASYRTGKQEFSTIIEIQRMLVMAKLDYHMAVMSLLDSQSLLERAVGGRLDKIDKGIERGDK